MLRIGVTGGIGSGKTTACLTFKALGVPVYDSDSSAKRLMATDSELIEGIKELLGEEAYRNGELNRGYVAEKIFNNKELLQEMNAIVHPTVIRDFERWSKRLEAEGVPYLIQENAILFEGGFDSYVDLVVAVSAPAEQRIERTAKRDGVENHKVRARMDNQMSDKEKRARADYVVDNSEGVEMLPQILELHRVFLERSSVLKK